MVLELLFLALLVGVVCAFVYRGAVHEFQILQKDFDEENNWSELLSEELPLVIRGIPKSWLGAWSERLTGKKSWQIMIKQDGRRFKTTWANWLASPSPKPQPMNLDEICGVARLQYNFSNWTADGFRRWSWLPVGAPKPRVFNAGDFSGVQKLTAEFTAITSTDGAPLELWVAHEGAIPANVSTDLIGKNPWTQTTEDIPWIGEVKYIEIKLRPGNAIVVPKHWWLAIRPTSADDAAAAWFWIGEFHTPVSRVASAFQRAKSDD
jgi:hypothetical protein